MESAIAPHLRCPRTRDRRVETDYTPPYPAWVARAAPSMQQVVMGYFGVQSRGREQQGRACAALRRITQGFETADGPGHHDLAHYVDAAGYDNMIAIAYWSDAERFARWHSDAQNETWWRDDERLNEGLGYFREIASPRVEHYESLFSTPDRLEGIGVVMGGISEDIIQEHAYWGSARERIALAQTDALSPSGSLAADATPGLGRRVRVAGHHNVTLIRSGQEWSETEGRERELYLKEMEPVLREGMDFLRDAGTTIGCYVNRYMRHIDASGEPKQKTFGLSYWHALADMERWAEAHPTHLAIFGTFMRIVQEMNFQLKLRLYHEVSVLKANEQDYEYINCHANTGLMNGLRA
jgi:aldoxime dehydratase